MELLISEYQDLKMQIDYKIPTHGVRLLNFDVILRDSISRTKLDCNKYLLNFDIETDNNVRKLFINNLIITTCERIKTTTLIDKIIVYVNTNTYLLPVDSTIKNLIVKILNSISINYISADVSFDNFINNLTNRDIDSMYIFNKAYNKFRSNCTLNTKKLIKFLKTNGLIYLTNTYFKDTSNKMIVLR
jgi:hypothetical protein